MFDIFGAPDLRQLMISYAHALGAHESDIGAVIEAGHPSRIHIEPLPAENRARG